MTAQYTMTEAQVNNTFFVLLLWIVFSHLGSIQASEWQHNIWANYFSSCSLNTAIQSKVKSFHILV